MLSSYVKTSIGRYTREEQEELYSYLSNLLMREAYVENRQKILCDIMRQIIGEEFIGESRKTNLIWARTMVAYQLSKDGYSSVKIGKILHKDHCTILHHLKKMEDALQFPKMYWDIMPIWNEFQKRINDETITGTI